MKKSNLIKIFSILVIGVMVVMFTTNVFAANNTSDEYIDLSNTINTNANNNTNTNTNTNSNTNSNKSNTNSNKSNTNNTSNTNNSSIYNNTNLPKTGIEDSIPATMLIVVFGISAIYAYKKINDYKNI